MKNAKVQVSTRITDLAVLLLLGGGVASPLLDTVPLSSGEGSSFMFVRTSLACVRERGG